MEGPRAPTTQEFPELVKFLDENLRSKEAAPWSVAEEYPTALIPQNIQNFRIIKDQNQILSHALVKPLVIKTRRGLIKVGAIGSVVTQSQFRNQGLSQAIIKDCLDVAKNQGCDLAILWTNLYDFYRKMGFELAGGEISLILESVPPAQSHPFKIVQSNKVDPQALFRIFSQHTVTSIRTLEDFEKYLRIPNSRLYTAWDKEGKMAAYAVEGKGADLQGYVHEWGGGVDALAALFGHIRHVTGQPLTVISPAHSQGLIKKLGSMGARRVDGFLGMVKMTNPEAFFSKVIKNVRQEWGVDNFVLEKKGDFYFYGMGKDIFQTDQESDIVRLVFGPQKPSVFHDNGPQLNVVLDKIFPFELWVWGWDSV